MNELKPPTLGQDPFAGTLSFLLERGPDDSPIPTVHVDMTTRRAIWGDHTLQFLGAQNTPDVNAIIQILPEDIFENPSIAVGKHLTFINSDGQLVAIGHPILLTQTHADRVSDDLGLTEEETEFATEALTNALTELITEALTNALTADVQAKIFSIFLTGLAAALRKEATE